ncbi:hypothetical protein [Streptomyces sp. 8L]|uniref:hypothetical protein n=1 Tax=Streptomyces sp. 8L TaxID=2877242 RepID=UPI0035A8F924
MTHSDADLGVDHGLPVGDPPRGVHEVRDLGHPVLQQMAEPSGPRLLPLSSWMA